MNRGYSSGLFPKKPPQPERKPVHKTGCEQCGHTIPASRHPSRYCNRMCYAEANAGRP